MKQKDKNNMWKIFAFFKLNIMLLFVGFKDKFNKDHVRIKRLSWYAAGGLRLGREIGMCLR